jgi:ferric-dicitrate binding protein FerR (iron transport regulator)
MTDPERLHELLEKHLDQVADDAELAELDRMLSSDPAAADALARLADFETALSSSTPLSMDFKIERSGPKWPAAKKRKWAWVAAAGILLALGLTGAWFAWQRSDSTKMAENPPAAEEEAGRLVIDAKGDSQVPLRQRVEAPADKPALVALPDGARTELSPASVAIFHGKVGDVRELVELIEGTGSFRVQKGKGEFRVQTIVGNVTALGTEFKVGLQLPERAKDDRKKTMPVWLLEVDVSEGSVQVETWREKAVLVAPARQVFRTERPPDLRGVILGDRRSKRGGFGEIDIDITAANGPPQIRTLRVSWTTRMDRDFKNLVGKPASVWLDAGSLDMAAWIVGD